MTRQSLADAIADYGSDAFLLSVSSSGPHTSQISVRLDGNTIECALGKSAAKNLASMPNVSLFWPPRERGGYAMIVNGVAAVSTRADGTPIGRITMTKSVLHRSGPRQDDSDGPCVSDCKQLLRAG